MKVIYIYEKIISVQNSEEEPLTIGCNHYALFVNYIKLQWDDHPFPRPPLPALQENDLSTQAFSGKIVFLSDEENVFD